MKNILKLFIDDFNEELLKRALKEDKIEYKVTTVIIQGEAGVGKTSLKSLILHLSYDEVSTSCIEAPRIAYYGSTDSQVWNLVTDDEMNDNIIAELQQCAKANVLKKSTLEESPCADITREPPNTAHIHNNVTATDNSSSMSPNPYILPQEISFSTSQEKSSATSEALDESIGFQHEQPMLIADTYQPAYNNSETTSKENINFDPLEFCKNKCKSHGFQHRRWLHFFDSGGQIQFQKLLLAFMPCTTALILVVNLSKNLSEPSSTSMRNKDGVTDVDEYSLSVEHMLKQLLSAVIFKFQTQITDIPCIEVPEKENILVTPVGTHCDELEESSRHAKIMETKAKLFEMLLALKDMCQYKEYVFQLYEVDGSKAKRGEFDDPQVKEISELLKEGAYGIDVPLRWHYFGVILRIKAKESKGMLKKSSCEEFGKLLEMEPDEVRNALRFFHTLKMLFYYHDSPAKDIVFVKLDSLIKLLEELVKVVLKTRNKQHLKPKIEKLTTRGFLYVTTLQNSSKAFKDIAETIFDNNADICAKKLLELFEFLKIGARLPDDDNPPDDKIFLMPALLPVGSLDTQCLPDTIPLLFYFKNAVPMGLFCAVIVHLLSDPKKRWQIMSNDTSNFSNLFHLQKDIVPCDCFDIVLVERLYWIEIYCENTSSYRFEAKEAIDAAISGVMKDKVDQKIPVMKDKVDQKIPAFKCSFRCKNKNDHVAKVHIHKSTEDSFHIKCKDKCQELLESDYKEYCSWFMDQKKIDTIIEKMEKRKDIHSKKWNNESECTLYKA